MATLRRVMHDVYPFIDTAGRLKGAAAGKTVLVTGGSRGIGLAIARHFALAGASSVIITGRSKSSLDTAIATIKAAVGHSEYDAIALQADMTDVEAVQSVYDGLKTLPDVVVNSIGENACDKTIIESDPDTWWKDWETNLKTTYLSSRSYLRALAGKPGVILNLSSSASNTTNPTLSSYASSKSAVNRLSEFIHFEHSKEGVRCIAFHPGGILDTGMGQNAPSYFKPYLFDTLDLAGATAVYLSTPGAGFLSGRFIFSNYDMEQLERFKDEIIDKDLLKTRIELGEHLNGVVVPPSGSKEG